VQDILVVEVGKTFCDASSQVDNTFFRAFRRFLLVVTDIMFERSFLESGGDDCWELVLYEISGEGEDVGVRELGKTEELFGYDLVMFHIPYSSSKLLDSKFPIPDRLASIACRCHSFNPSFMYILLDMTTNQAAGRLERVAVVEEIVAEEGPKDICVRASVRD